jgi:hypothetical protein
MAVTRLLNSGKKEIANSRFRVGKQTISLISSTLDDAPANRRSDSAIVRNTCYTWMQHNSSPQLRIPLDDQLHRIESKDLNPEALLGEIRGEELFFGKANCSACHTPPYYTDNSIHDLQVERFYKPRMEGGMLITAQGPIKTFPLRGIKESPPYLHDGRLLTLEDTVEFFNLVLGTKLTQQEKGDLTTFLRAL